MLTEKNAQLLDYLRARLISDYSENHLKAVSPYVRGSMRVAYAKATTDVFEMIKANGFDLIKAEEDLTLPEVELKEAGGGPDVV